MLTCKWNLSTEGNNKWINKGKKHLLHTEYCCKVTQVEFVSNLNPLCSDCRFYQRRSTVLWRHREPGSVPLLRPEPHRGPLGLHHLSQVGVSAPPLRVELQIQQRSSEDDGTELRSVFTTGRSHTEKPLGHDSPTDQRVLQFSSVTQLETFHYARLVGLLLLTKSRQTDVAKNSLSDSGKNDCTCS